MKFKPKTPEELRQIAVDIFHGRVFTDRHLPQGNHAALGWSFPILNFLTEKDRKIFSKDLGMVYEYLDKASHLGVNGNPTFFSCRRLSVAESKKVWTIYAKLKKAEESVVGKGSDNGKSRRKNVPAERAR